MLKIFLVRHGATFWNSRGIVQGHSDVQLAPDGIYQARLLAENFPVQKVSAIYSSDLSRAKTTAEIIANKFSLEVETLPEIREINFGDWEKKTFRELNKNDPENFKIFLTEPDKLKIARAETFLQVQERAVSALKKIIIEHDEKTSEKNIVIVAHGAVNRLILCKILEIPIRRIWAISQFNTAVNIIRADDENFTVELVNGTSHLQKILLQV